MVDSGSIPHRLVDGICSGTVYPFVGAGFSKNAANGRNYPSTVDLARKLVARLPADKCSQLQQSGTSGFLDVAAEYERTNSLTDLHYEIRDILPDVDEPGDCHRLFMTFPWRRIYTTNYDSLLEKADEGRSISVAYDDKLVAVRGTARKPVIKLCGDFQHMPQMRATRERLQLTSLENDCPVICEDLLWHLGEVSFVFIGYSMNDDFLKFGRELVRRQARKKEIDFPTSFLLGVNLKAEERDRFKDSELTVIDLRQHGFGSDTTSALKRFFEFTLDYCREWEGRHSPYQQRPQPIMSRVLRGKWLASYKLEPTQLEETIYPWSDAKNVPIIVASTEGQRSQESLQRCVRPVLEEAGYKELLISVGDTLTTPFGTDKWQSAINRVLSQSFCAIFVFDQLSEPLEELVERAISRRCRAIILCNDEADLGFITADLRHRPFSHDALPEYVAEELFNANVEQRLSRATELFKAGHPDMCVLQAWMVCEIAHSHARKKLGESMPEEGLSSLQKPARLVGFLRGHGYVVEEELEASIESTRLVRNKAAHDGYEPCKDEAEAALAMAKKLVRLLHREDLPGFLRELTTNITTQNDKDPERV